MSSLATTVTSEGEVMYHAGNVVTGDNVPYNAVYPAIKSNAEFLVNRFTGMVVPNVPELAARSDAFVALHVTLEELQQMEARGEPLPHVAPEAYTQHNVANEQNPQLGFTSDFSAQQVTNPMDMIPEL